MRYIAFLRAINVGGHTVKMERLRAMFESLGLAGVETFIASGNVIFEVRAQARRALEARIEAHLRAGLGYDVATFLRTPAELRAVAECPAFAGDEIAGGTVYVAFVAGTPSQLDVTKLQSEHDEFRVHGREIYWLRRSADSAFTGSLLEKAIGVRATMRGMNTVSRLAAKYAP